MARYLFGGALTDFGIEPPSDNSGNVVALVDSTGTAWDSVESGDRYIDLLEEDGNSATTEITTDSDGYLVPFFGPDEVRWLYLDFGAGRRFFTVAPDALTEQTDVLDIVNQALADFAEEVDPLPQYILLNEGSPARVQHAYGTTLPSPSVMPGTIFTIIPSLPETGGS